MQRVRDYPAHLHASDDLVQSIRLRRGGQLTNLDLLLLHSPPFAAGWNTMMGGVRTGFSIDRNLQELLICAVAVLTGAQYEYFHHAPLYMGTGGKAEKLDALNSGGDFYSRADLFTPVECAALKLACEMTTQVRVNDDTFARVRQFFDDDRSVVELVATVASYNMVSRFLVALGIQPERT